METSKQVNAAIDRSVRLSYWMDDKLPNAVAPGRKEHLAVALFSIANDHREAILCLLRHGARTSAIALARSVYEAYVRGSWVQLCATEVQCEEALGEGGRLPKLETMIRGLDAVPETAGAFSESKRQSWSVLSNYAHGEMLQAQRWIGEADIAPQHLDAEVLELLRFLDAYGLLCCAGIAEVCGMSIAPFAEKVANLKGGDRS